MSKIMKLEKLKRRIESLVATKAQTEGQLKLLYEKLKQEGFNSVEEAEQELNRLSNEYDILNKKCDELIEEIEEKLEEVEQW